MISLSLSLSLSLIFTLSLSNLSAPAAVVAAAAPAHEDAVSERRSAARNAVGADEKVLRGDDEAG